VVVAAVAVVVAVGAMATTGFGGGVPPNENWKPMVAMKSVGVPLLVGSSKRALKSGRSAKLLVSVALRHSVTIKPTPGWSMKLVLPGAGP